MDPSARHFVREFLGRLRIISACMPSIRFLIAYAGTYRSTKHGGKNIVSRRDTQKKSELIYRSPSTREQHEFCEMQKGGSDLHVIGDGIRCGASIIKRAMNNEGLRIPRDVGDLSADEDTRTSASRVKCQIAADRTNVSGTVPSIEQTSGM